MSYDELNRAKRNGEDMEDSGNHLSFTEIGRDLYEAMEKRGYKIVPDMSGVFANHRVFALKKVKYAGVDKPVEFWSELVKPSNDNKISLFMQDRQRFDNQVDAYIHMYIEAKQPDKPSFKLINEMHKGLQGIASSNANPLAGYAKRDNGLVSYTRSFTGQRAFSQVPQLSWFHHLKGLDPYELLALFPKAEADVLMLTLGSMLTGNDQGQILEGTVSHFMRTAVVLYGKEAQLGKSFLLGAIVEALGELGYSTSSIGEPGARFGWGEIAKADLSYRDDMNEKDQETLLNNTVIKSIISKGSITTERKGVDAVVTSSRSTVIGCSNYYSKNQFLGSDAGTLSRIRFLYTYNSKELKKLGRFQDGQVAINWKPQTIKYGVDRDTLACYLLAHCAAKFLEATGYELKHGQLVQTGEDKSLLIIKELTEQLKLKTDIKHVDNLVLSVTKLVALAAVKKELSLNKMKAFLDGLDKIEFGHELLGDAMRAYSVSNPKTSAEYIMKLQSDCYKTISRGEERWSNAGHKKPAPEAFETQAKELLSTDSYKFPKSNAYYASVWEESRKDMEEHVELYKDFDFDELGDDLSGILESVWRTVKPQGI